MRTPFVVKNDEFFDAFLELTFGTVTTPVELFFF